MLLINIIKITQRTLIHVSCSISFCIIRSGRTKSHRRRSSRRAPICFLNCVRTLIYGVRTSIPFRKTRGWRKLSRRRWSSWRAPVTSIPVFCVTAFFVTGSITVRRSRRIWLACLSWTLLSTTDRRRRRSWLNLRFWCFWISRHWWIDG
jgi:hypothetical protein